MNARTDASAFGRVDGPEHAIAEMEAMKRIWIREQYTNQLKTLCKSVRRDVARLRRHTVRYGRPIQGSEEERDLFKRLGKSYTLIARLIRELRISSIEVVEAISAWRKGVAKEERKAFVSHPQTLTFVWRGVNYIRKMMRDMSFLDRPDKDTIKAVRRDVAEDAPKIAREILLAREDGEGGDGDSKEKNKEKEEENDTILAEEKEGAGGSSEVKKPSAESQHAALTQIILAEEHAVVDSADDAIRTWMGLEASGNPLLLHELLLEAADAKGRAKPWTEYDLDGFTCVRDRLEEARSEYERRRAKTEERIRRREHRGLL